MARSKKSNGAGKLSISQMRDLINKKAGINVAHSLTEENPTAVRTGFPPVLDGLILLSVKDS